MGTRVVAVYCRISRDSEGRAEGVATQERKGRKLARDLWPDLPVRVYRDNDLSAADPTVERPAYTDMVQAIRKGEVAEVVAAEQSRLTRRPSEWEELAVALAKAGITAVHTYRSGRVEVGKSMLLGRIMAAVDAEEVARLKARIGDKLDALAAEGRPPGGRAFGYRSTVDEHGRKAREVIPQQAEAARWAADKVLSGWSLTGIAAALEEQGVPTALGGHWTSTTVRTVLTTPAIAGFRVHQGRVVGAGTWEPILPEPVWRQVRAVIAAPAVVERRDGGTYKVSRKRQPAQRYLLSGGVAVCGRCGCPLVAQQRRSRAGGRQPSYLCHPSRGGCSGIGIGAAPLEAHVVETLLSELERPEFYAALVDTDHDTDRAALVARLGDVDQRRSELAKRWALGDLTSGEWDTARGVLDETRARLEAELAAVPAPAVMGYDPVTIRDDWADVEMTLAMKRHIVRQYIDSVVVNPATPGTRRFDAGRVEIRWRE